MDGIKKHDRQACITGGVIVAGHGSRLLVVVGVPFCGNSNRLPVFWRIACDEMPPRALDQPAWIMVRRRVNDESLAQ